MFMSEIYEKYECYDFLLLLYHGNTYQQGSKLLTIHFNNFTRVQVLLSRNEVAFIDRQYVTIGLWTIFEFTICLNYYISLLVIIMNLTETNDKYSWNSVKKCLRINQT